MPLPINCIFHVFSPRLRESETGNKINNSHASANYFSANNYSRTSRAHLLFLITIPLSLDLSSGRRLIDVKSYL